MRKIIVFNLITLDGFYAGENDDISWHQVDDEFNKFAIEQTQEFGGLIFGKTTYKIFEDFWPVALKDPKTSPDDRKIAQIIDDMWKIVFSKTLKNVTWNNTKLYHDIDVKEVESWKKYDGKDLAIFGSGTIVQQFAKLGLIDEYRLMVNPVVLGKGKAMFNGVENLKLKLLKSHNFKNGNVLLYYVPQY
jgi:dihydrofolate reductase